jgi:hypothetical protein
MESGACCVNPLRITRACARAGLLAATAGGGDLQDTGCEAQFFVFGGDGAAGAVLGAVGNALTDDVVRPHESVRA